MKKIAVLYLARKAENKCHIENFANSYRNHPAGIPHDLIIIHKGDFKKNEKESFKKIFEGLPYQPFFISDEGFDIHAYLKVASEIPHYYVCFFNTFSVILSDNWLKKLFHHLKKTHVGMVGTTASYESLLSSIKLLQYVRWSAERNELKYGEEAYFQWILTNNFSFKRIVNIGRILLTKNGVFEIKKKLINFAKRYSLKESHKNSSTTEFEEWWNTVIAPEGKLGFLKDFPSFPNPHIRSNGFMVKRELLLEYNHLEKTKEACCRFESGFDGLTRRILKKGFSVLLVGANGRAYSPEQWPQSGTYLIRAQKNLIMRDNRTQNYSTMPLKEAQTHSYIAWGDYLENKFPIFDIFKETFKKHPLIEDKNNSN